MKYIADVTTLEFDHDKCTGCGKCVEVCPHGVFAMNEKKAKVIDKDLCMECGACAKTASSMQYRSITGLAVRRR